MDKTEIQKALDNIYPYFRKVRMDATNLDLAANFAGFKIDWDTGKVLGKE